MTDEFLEGSLMNFQSKAQPIGCIGPQRFTKHFFGQLTGLAGAILIGLCQPVAAQTATLTNGGVTAGAISCAPSNNGTGHMVCLEYSTSESLIGLSWQAPPGATGETTDTVDVDSLAAPGGTLVGAPGCGPENDGLGTAACLVVSKTTSGSFTLQGIAFYPPTDDAGKTTPSRLVTLATEPADAVIGNPSCTTAGAVDAVVCAITINGQLFGIGFEPKNNINTALTPLLSGASVTGNPSCASAENDNAIPAVCAVREGNSLVGFALTFTPPPTAAIAAEDAMPLGSMAFVGDPSCAIPANGQVGATSFVATCGIVSGATLFGLAFDPIDAIPSSSPSSHTTPFESLGSAPDAGSWTGNLGCSGISDFRFGTPTNANQFPNASPNQNLIGCAILSSTNNVFEESFDPRLPVSRGVVGPFGRNANATLSCILLAIDRDNIYCGGTTTAGASAGYTLQVGILPPAAAPAFLQLVSD
jgi:hypothetical protein